MASIIKSDNGVSSGVTGIVQIADSSGQLAFQTTTSGGSAVTALTIDNNQKVTFANSIGFGSNQGIIFNPSTQGSGHTSNTLTDYEEVTWTPVLTPSSGTITSSTITGTYSKVGNLVFVAIRVLITNNGTGSAGLSITGFPFAAKTATTISGATREDTSVGFAIVASPSSTTSIFLSKYDGSYPGGNNYGFSLCLTYNATF